MALRHAEEILIRTAPTNAILSIVLASIALFAAPLAIADEFDWLYFPMYPNDTAHAVHLGALQFRPDGLLSAATRYPRTSGEAWTEQESKAGWYSYEERLIDCETGLFVETATSLLGRDGAKLVTRAAEHDKQVSRLEMQLRGNAAQRWPKHSEILLACAAASSPAFKKQRAAQAAKAQPLLSNTSLTEVLSADSEALFASARLRYDFGRIEKLSSASASDLFHAMRGQHLAWRKSINGAYVPGDAAGAGNDEAVRANANRQLELASARHVTIKSIRGAVIEHTYSGGSSRSSRDEEGAPIESARTDCEYGISVPYATQKRHPDGKPQASSQLRAKTVLPEIKGRYAEHPEGKSEGPFGGFSLAPHAAAMCQLVSEIRNPPPAVAPDIFTALAFGIEPGALARHATPASMLLAIRAARRLHAR